MTSQLSNIAEIRRIAAAYPDVARFTSVEIRERYFSEAQKAAWSLRIERKPKGERP